MIDANEIRDIYLQAWNEADDVARADLIEKRWSPGATYVDPMMAGEGQLGIAEMIGGARVSFPGHSFSPRGEVDAHGPYVRFSWSLSAGGAPVANGTDIVRLDGDGRIEQVVGFLDPA